MVVAGISQAVEIHQLKQAKKHSSPLPRCPLPLFHHPPPSRHRRSTGQAGPQPAVLAPRPRPVRRPCQGRPLQQPVPAHAVPARGSRRFGGGGGHARGQRHHPAGGGCGGVPSAERGEEGLWVFVPPVPGTGKAWSVTVCSTMLGGPCTCLAVPGWPRWRTRVVRHHRYRVRQA